MEEKYSMEESKNIRIGLISIFIVLFIVFMTVSHNASIKGNDLNNAYKIYASFGRTDGLNIGDVVRMAGITIGRVTEANLDENFNAKLTLEIDSQYLIPDDSSASIVSYGLIGGKYVEIDVGGSEDFIQPAGEIGYTQDAMILEELLDRIIAIGKAKVSKKTEDSKADVKTEIEGDENE